MIVVFPNDAESKLRLTKMLNEFLDYVFQMAEVKGINDRDLAKLSGLSPATVHNQCQKVTKYPRFDTVYRLSKAVGLERQLIRAANKMFTRRGKE